MSARSAWRQIERLLHLARPDDLALHVIVPSGDFAMAVCWVCEREMSDRRVTACDAEARRREVPMFIGDETYQPLPFAIDRPVERCRDCGVLKGQIHHFGCCVEECPVCGGPFISCGCFDECYEHLCDGDDEESG